jgi:hypothetical protein
MDGAVVRKFAFDNQSADIVITRAIPLHICSYSGKLNVTMKEIRLEDPGKTEIINTRAGFANKEQLWYLG